MKHMFRYTYSDGKDSFTRVFSLEQIENGDAIEEIYDSSLLRDYKIVERLHLGLTATNPERYSNECESCHRCIEEKKLTGAFDFPLSSSVMIVCPICGNKRCPKASDHRLECTNSNEPGQKGSVYE